MFRIGQRWHRLSLLFLASLVFCLVFNAWSTGQAEQPGKGIDRQVLVSSLDGDQQSYASAVRQGIERYQSGRFPEAIALWEEALPKISATKDRAIVHSNLALAYRQTGQLQQAIAQWEKAIQIYRFQSENVASASPQVFETTTQPLAGLLTEQAQAYNDLGQHQRAITLLKEAIEIARKNQDRLAEAGAMGALGNAYWSLGVYEEASEAEEVLPESALVAHQRALDIARDLNNTSYIATALNNLGNVHASRATRYSYQARVAELEGDDKEANRLTLAAAEDRNQARAFFGQSVQTARGVAGLEEVRALMNLTRLVEQSSPPDQDLILRNWSRVRELLASAPDSRDKAYALINLAESFRRNPSVINPYSSLQTLEQALAVARSIGDARAESFALGSLGKLYEETKEYGLSMELTRKAQFAAQNLIAPDSLYLWQWQAARILRATGTREEAIAAYEQAIATLQSIRGDILAANQELQLDFREQVEPIYRELIELLLESPNANASSDSDAANGVNAALSTNSLKRESKGVSLKLPSQADNSWLTQAPVDSEVTPPDSNTESSTGEASPLQKVIDNLERLKLAELQNFFGDECVQVARSQAASEQSLTDTNTAVIYSVILNDQTEMILRSPNGSLTSYRVPISKQELEKEIEDLRFSLEARQIGEQYLPQSQKIYNLLIRPIEADLAAANLSTLIIINDRALRQVPMAALHDGQEFLVQKYAIATTPSLTLTSLKPLNRSNLAALSVGLTVGKPPFPPLTNVQAEVTAVNDILGGTELIDEAFTVSNLEAQLQQKSYPIVHMATHGKFGVDAESTFLVGFDQRISIGQLDNLLREAKQARRDASGSVQPVELLTLSACQTAAGDDRSALGIAGVAVRAGVESALATLWYINDQATVPLIEEFYRQLRQPDITKAEALRQAQLKMIADVSYNHPAVWSPFTLIGNWL